MPTAKFSSKKKGKVIVILIIAALVVAGIVIGILLWKGRQSYIPEGFSADIDDQIKFYITITWEDIAEAEEYNVEYEYSLYSGQMHSQTVTSSEITIDRKRGELKYRVQSVIKGKANPFSAWQSYAVAPMELPFFIPPTLEPSEELENTFILNLPIVVYERYDKELVAVPTFEIKDKLPSETNFGQSIFRVISHSYTLPADEKGTFTVKVRALNNTTFTATDEKTGQLIPITENIPVELYDLYEPSDWIEISIEIE